MPNQPMAMQGGGMMVRRDSKDGYDLDVAMGFTSTMPVSQVHGAAPSVFLNPSTVANGLHQGQSGFTAGGSKGSGQALQGQGLGQGHGQGQGLGQGQGQFAGTIQPTGHVR